MKFIDKNQNQLRANMLYKEGEGLFYYITNISDNSISFDSLRGSVQGKETFKGEEAVNLASRLSPLNPDCMNYIAEDLISRGKWFLDKLK